MTDEDVKQFVGKNVKALMCVDRHPYPPTKYEETGVLVKVGCYRERGDDVERIHYVFNGKQLEIPYTADDFASISLLEVTESKNSGEQLIKPPLGLKPKFVWLDERIEEIKAAVNRCFDANYPINTEWIEEYNELVKSEELK